MSLPLFLPTDDWSYTSSIVPSGSNSIMAQASYSFMPNTTHALFTGGTYNQSIHHHEHQHPQTMGKSAFDLLLEAVAPAAFHNSGQRFDPPKCHPNTRTAAIQKIMNWIYRSDPETRDAMVMWLSGAAGAGKSAIAQTLAELCSSHGRLLASFFFGRSDPTRNHGGLLIATLTYQLYTLLPSIRPHIIAAIEGDPLIFKRSLSTQFQTLIIQPLQPLFLSGFFGLLESPRLIIIDGLDECLDHKVQRNILDVFSGALRDTGIPLLVLVASRPEHDIKTMFNSPAMTGLRTDLMLDDSYLPDEDIELFLRESFQECKENHPFKQYIPSSWPCDRLIDEVVWKSSGQFIYAATVVRYVTSGRHHPRRRLEEVLGLARDPDSQDFPFAELDALYSHILSSVDSIGQVLRIISFVMVSRSTPTVDMLEMIFELEAGSVALLFCDLSSVIDIRQEHGTCSSGSRYTRTDLCFLHASLRDFLLNPIRSRDFYIDLSIECTQHAKYCIRFVSRMYIPFSPLKIDQWIFLILRIFDDLFTGMDFSEGACLVNEVATEFLNKNSDWIILDDELIQECGKVSFPDYYQRALDDGPNGPWLLDFYHAFVPAFFKILQNSNLARAKDLYTNHLEAYDKLLISTLDSYGRHPHIQLLLALVGLSGEGKTFPVGALHAGMLSYVYRDLNFLDVCSLFPEYIKFLADFLEDRKRSKQYTLGPELFTGGALCCLKYLSDHRSKQQMAPPRYSQHEKHKRKNKPWIWRRRFPKTEVVGNDTPRMWLRKLDEDGDIEATRILHKNRRDLVYIHAEHLYIYEHHLKDPVVAHRVWSEKYWLHLSYLLYFLPRSKKSDELIELCQHSTFASRSQDFPRRSRKARRVMVEYLARVGADIY